MGKLVSLYIHPFLPGRAGLLSKTGGATASEILTVTTVTRLVVLPSATEHMKESTASQTTGLSSAFGPLFTPESSFWDLEMKTKYFIRSDQHNVWRHVKGEHDMKARRSICVPTWTDLRKRVTPALMWFSCFESSKIFASLFFPFTAN